MLLVRKFCDPSFSDGIALQPELERMARGTPVLQLSEEFQNWVGALQMISVVERSIEAKHHLIAQALRRAPGAGAAYLSNELRFDRLAVLLDNNPSLIYKLCEVFAYVNKPAGLDAVIARMIGGAYCVPTRALTQSEHHIFLTNVPWWVVRIKPARGGGAGDGN